MKQQQKLVKVQTHCFLPAHHAGDHLFVKTSSPAMALFGDCPATPESVAAAIAEIDAAYPLALTGRAQ